MVAPHRPNRPKFTPHEDHKKQAFAIAYTAAKDLAKEGGRVAAIFQDAAGEQFTAIPGFVDRRNGERWIQVALVIPDGTLYMIRE